MWRGFLLAIFVFSVGQSHAGAALVVNFGNTTVTPDSGSIKQVDVFLSATDSSIEATSLRLVLWHPTDGGHWVDESWEYASEGMLFGDSLFDLESQSASPESISLSLTAKESVMITTAPRLLASVKLDISGLVPRLEPYAFEYVTTVTAPGMVTSGRLEGQFTVQAVPEPGSMLVLGLVSGVAAWRRRRDA